MKNFTEYFVTIFLVAVAIVVSVNLMARAVDKKEISNCKNHIIMAKEYPDYFITQADKEACELYHIDVTSIRVIDAK